MKLTNHDLVKKIIIIRSSRRKLMPYRHFWLVLLYNKLRHSRQGSVSLPDSPWQTLQDRVGQNWANLPDKQVENHVFARILTARNQHTQLKTHAIFIIENFFDIPNTFLVSYFFQKET